MASRGILRIFPRRAVSAFPVAAAASHRQPANPPPRSPSAWREQPMPRPVLTADFHRVLRARTRRRRSTKTPPQRTPFRWCCQARRLRLRRRNRIRLVCAPCLDGRVPRPCRVARLCHDRSQSIGHEGRSSRLAPPSQVGRRVLPGPSSRRQRRSKTHDRRGKGRLGRATALTHPQLAPPGRVRRRLPMSSPTPGHMPCRKPRRPSLTRSKIFT
jgi:hypothetical protein